MVIRIGQFDITECWDGVFYKKLSQYPQITEWEIQTVLDFISYEASNGRTCEIKAKKRLLTQSNITDQPMIWGYGFNLP